MLTLCKVIVMANAYLKHDGDKCMISSLAFTTTTTTAA